MNLIKKVWYDKDDIEMGIITKVLDKYCVPYTKRQKRIVEDIFEVFNPEYRWDIEVELATDVMNNGKSSYDFIIEKVQERLNLEDAYDAVEDEHDKEMRKSIIKACGDPFNILSPINGDKPLSEKLADAMENNEVIRKALEEKTMFENIKAFWNKVKQRVTGLFKKKKQAPKSIMDLYKKYMTPEAIKHATSPEAVDKYFTENGLKDQIKQDLREYFGDPKEIAHNILGETLKAMTPETKGDVVKFDDLPELDKLALRSQFPENLLRSNKCVIRRVQKDNQVALSIEIRG